MRRMVEAIVAGRPIPRASIDAINALDRRAFGRHEGSQDSAEVRTAIRI